MFLFEHQIDNSKKIIEILEVCRCAVDMSEMGTGKTFTALNVAKMMHKPVLVVCPKSIISTWVQAIIQFGFKEKFDVTNYEQIRLNHKKKYWKARGRTHDWLIDPNTLVIFDEAHRLKSPRSMISKICHRIENKILLLSATLALSPLEMRTAGVMLEMFKWGQFFAWVQLNGCKRNPRFGGYIYDINSDNNVWRKCVRRQSVCTKLHQVKDDMKDNLIQSQIIDVNNLNVINDAFDKYEELREKKESATAHIEALQYALQMCELEKVEYMRERIVDHKNQGYRTIVFLNYKETQKNLFKAIEKYCIEGLIINGETPQTLRDNYLKRWMNNEVDCLILTYGTCGEGISLDDKTGLSKRIVLLSPNWSAIKMKQALGRAYRASTKSDVIQQIVFAKGTLEEDVADSVKAKLMAIDKLTDDNLFIRKNRLKGESVLA